jgi:tetratricopeptide (TPR) repeat protein
MIPVIGLVQVGAQSMADRYTYIPLLGVFWIVVWAVADLITRWRLPGRVVALATLLVLGTCAARTRDQLDYWRDGESLFRHAIAITKNNFIAFDGLGHALYNKGRLDEAVFYCLKSLEIRPRYIDALKNLGDALARLDVVNATTNNPHMLARRTGADYAIAHNTLGVVQGVLFTGILPPADYAIAHNTLGVGLAMNGKLDDAISHFRKALLYNPDHANARSNLGYALALQGRLDEAIGQCEQILRLSPHHPAANNALGFALMKQGRLDEAVAHLREALQYQPDNPEAHFHLGQALAALGQRDEAIAHFKEVLRLAPNYRDAREQLKKLEGLSQ